ncbi:MAG: FtsX-like permease family protein [Candidatus Bathyarchaeia archaeon]
MKIFDLFFLSFEALKERKLRAGLTILMVVIGAALVTGLNGITTGINEYMVKQFSTLGANVIIILPGSQSMRLDSQVAKNLERIHDVLAALPFIQQSVTAESRGSSRNIFVMGIDQQKLHLVIPTLELESGSLLQPNDGIGMVVGNNVAYPPGQSTPFAQYGQSIAIEYLAQEGTSLSSTKRSFQVKGIIKYMGTTNVFIPIDRMAIISLNAANSFFKRAGVYDGILLVARDQDIVEEIVKEVRKILGTNVEIFTAKSIIQTIQNMMGALQVLMGSVASVSLIVASVGILAGLYTAVMERTKEIGILKAIGFKNRMILLLFLNEALWIGIIGGLIGDLLGIGLGQGLAMLAGEMRARATAQSPVGELGYIPPMFTFENLTFVWIFCLVLSVIAGIYPAWRASRLDPVVALRKE